MPRPGQRRLHQWAVLWEKIDDDFQGEPVLDDPVEIRCRWEDRKSQATNADGTVIGLDASVKVRTDIPIDSLMMLGRIIDLAGTSTGFDAANPEIMQVKTLSKTPDMRARTFTRVLGLQRFRGNLPAQVG